ncbi:MAG: deoxynucleoside kinase [Candidatus Woesearchaeota archaeon]
MSNFFVVEGDNGVGKTSVLQIISGIQDVVLCKTPQIEYTPIRVSVDNSENNHARFLYYLSSTFFAESTIRKFPKEPRVICDRYITSCFVDYAIREKLDFEVIYPIYTFFNNMILQPTKSFLLTCDHEQRIHRVSGRTNNSINDNLTKEYSNQTNALYQGFITTDPDSWHVINTTHRKLDDIADEMWQVISNVHC